MKHNIIPMPNKPLVYGSGAHSLANSIMVDFGPFNPSCVAAFGERTSTALQAATENATLVLTKNAAFAAEEYSLDIDKIVITIQAATEQGVIWALTSLYHLLDERTVPCLQLNDSPKYAHRGYMLDCARHFFSAEEVKKIIEEISLVKMSVFHWHLSDDQGFRIQSDIFPQLHKDQDFYTKAQIKDIVAYAKLRGVEVIPEIDMPAHASAIVAAMPQLTCHNTQVSVKTQGGLYKVTLCPGKDETSVFITTLLDEVCELFDSPYFHIGNDEAASIEWETCPDCKRTMEENGITNVKGLQSHFTNRIVEHLRSKGMKPVVWNDFLDCPGATQNLDVQFWVNYHQDGKLNSFFRDGGETVFSTMVSTYFDYPHSFIPLEKVYSFVPDISGLQCADAPNTKGVECCVWTERIATTQRLGEMSFPRTYAMAEAGWTTQSNRDYASFEERLIPLLSGLTQKGISFTPPENWNPKGAQRNEQILEFFKMFRASMPVPSEVSITEMGEGKIDADAAPAVSPLLLALIQIFEITDPQLTQDLIAVFTKK